MDKAHGNQSGPTPKRILERECFNYGHAVYARLAGITVAQIYRFRNSSAYRQRNTSYQPTRPTVIPIGERRKPQPRGWPGDLRIDTVHHGDQVGRKGMYHISAVDEVTKWEIIAATPQVSKIWLAPNDARAVPICGGQTAGQGFDRTNQVAAVGIPATTVWSKPRPRSRDPGRSIVRQTA